MAENVPGLFSSDAGRFFGEVLNDLAALGYAVGWCTFGAVDVGALHRRNRVFIVGYAKHNGWDAAEVTRSVTEGGNGSTARTFSTCEFEGPGKQSETVAHSPQRENHGRERRDLDGEATERQGINSTVISGGQDVADTQFQQFNGCRGTRGRWAESSDGGIWQSEPNVGRVAHGIPHRVDRLKGLGNAVVPQQIYPIYKAIVEVETK